MSGRDRGSLGGNHFSSVFYADTYHPIQAGSIDGTDILPHDNAVYRALLCSSAGLYDPLGDPKAVGDPYCTVFVGRLSHQTAEDTLMKAMSKYGRVKNLRLVRHIVTGASRGYAFVEYETEKEMRRAYMYAHQSFIDDSEIIVDYNRQQLMPGWIPRRLGGGLGGKKESGQLRFGGRERPFRAPLRPIPYDDLKKLGIPPPPEGRYMPRFQVPFPPRRETSAVNLEEGTPHRHFRDREENTFQASSDNYPERTSNYQVRLSDKRWFESVEVEERHSTRYTEGWDRCSQGRSSHRPKRSTLEDSHSDKRSSKDRGEGDHKRHKSHHHERKSSGQKHSSDY